MITLITEIKPIMLDIKFGFVKFGAVNSYLIQTDAGYVLIDTGPSNSRVDLLENLATTGCKPGNLKLIIITHGDSDHAANAAYLREKFTAKIAIHKSESAVVESGDLFLARKNKPILARMILPLLKLNKSDRFKPDIYLEDGYDLSEYGLDAQVIHISGHSLGSIGILTTDGDLFCGDLLRNTERPELHFMDDLSAAKASIEKLESLDVKTVYPGHGEPFTREEFLKINKEAN